VLQKLTERFTRLLLLHDINVILTEVDLPHLFDVTIFVFFYVFVLSATCEYNQ